MILLVQYTLIFSAVLLLVALGGCVSEHSGVINLGLEGIMVIGALGGALFMKFIPVSGTFFSRIGIFLGVVFCSLAAGVLYSALLAVACINLKADQTIVGTALNMLGTALATVAVKSMNTARNPDDHSSVIFYGKAREAFLTSIKMGKQYFVLNWFVLVAVVMLIIIYVLLYKTKFGLRLRACGEHPQAAASVGINVFKMRWSGVLLSGMLAGLGGITYITAGVSTWKFENGVAGFGFLSLAVMIFGQWKPGRIALAALLFGFFRALSNVYFGFGWLMQLNIPGAVYNMMPYIISLVVLAFTSKKSRAPKAEGIPYDKSMR
jgi:simple sugar transport system permease protein